MREFASLVAVRNRKLDRFRAAEQQAKRERFQAVKAVEEARAAVEDYRKEIMTLELDLLNEVLNTRVTVTDLTAIEHTLKEAEEKAHALMDDVRQAEDALLEAEETQRQASLDKRAAQASLNKSTEILNILKEDHKAALVQAEDAEIDAFVEVRYGRAGASR
ncbi:hypothetical protein AB838_05795 [Rhodobacteraceae bacterium (ex Bugula neritina AB1)]|nr:hypothetical protein AB838_05795 [Rhodobacteraceae bacterium (ex Bugula neritina AB1)]